MSTVLLAWKTFGKQSVIATFGILNRIRRYYVDSLQWTVIEIIQFIKIYVHIFFENNEEDDDKIMK